MKKKIKAVKGYALVDGKDILSVLIMDDRGKKPKHFDFGYWTYGAKIIPVLITPPSKKKIKK